MSSADYPAHVLARYASHAETCAWVRAHPELELDEALVECDDPRVLVRLWAVSDLPLSGAYAAVRRFAAAGAADIPAPHTRDAREALLTLGRWLSVIERVRRHRRLRRLRATGEPRLVALAELVAETAPPPDGSWSAASGLSRQTQTAHLRALDALIERCAALDAHRGERHGERAVFRAVVPEQALQSARQQLAACFRDEASRVLQERRARREQQERARRDAGSAPAVPAQPPSLGVVLGTSLLAALLLPLIAALVSTAWGPLLGFLAGGLAGVVVAAYVGLRLGGEAGWLTAAVGLFGMIAGAMGGPSVLALTFGSGLAKVSLAALDTHPEASWYTFTDARVRPDLAYRRTLTSRDSKSGQTYTHEHAIAPLVGDDWTPGEPVPAWAYCTSRGANARYAGCRALWHEPHLGVLPANPMSYSDMLETRRLATVEGPIAQGVGAPIFLWVEDPTAHMVREARTGAWLLGGTYLIGALVVVARRRRRQPGERSHRSSAEADA